MDDLLYFIHSLNLPKDEYCVVGGAMMAVYGLRSLGTHDIDLLVKPDLYAKLKSDPNWTMIKFGSTKYRNPIYRQGYAYTPDDSMPPTAIPVEALNEDNFATSLPEIKTYISRAIFLGLEHVPFIQPVDMLQWKVKACNHRDKDKEDIELLNDYFANKP